MKERFRLQEHVRLTKVKSDSVKQVIWSSVNPLGPCFVTNDRDSGQLRISLVNKRKVVQQVLGSGVFGHHDSLGGRAE